MFYMADATVRSAKLASKSADELRKMGIGRDDKGFYLLANVSVPIPRAGVLAAARAVVNVATSLANVVEAKFGAPASPSVVALREKVCKACTEVDSTGQRLFRAFDPSRVSCGRPMDPTVKGFQLLRDPMVDGCGCWLLDKWASADQSCPRGKWGPELVREVKSQPKRRCCSK